MRPMTLKRVGDLVSPQTRSNPASRAIDLDPLEGDIFPHQSTEHPASELDYVSGSKLSIRSRLGKSLWYDEGALSLGAYEAKLFRCLIHSRESVYCILGHMGSGKTSTIKYIRNVLLNGKCT